LLSDIPIIGELFKSRENSKQTSELVAFITPIVVDNPSENDENYNKQERENLRDLSVPLQDRDMKYQRDYIREKMIGPKQPDGTPILSEPTPSGRPAGRAIPHQPPIERRPSPQSPDSWRPAPAPSEQPPSPPAIEEEPEAPLEEPAVPVDIDELTDDSSP